MPAAILVAGLMLLHGSMLVSSSYQAPPASGSNVGKRVPYAFSSDSRTSLWAPHHVDNDLSPVVTDDDESSLWFVRHDHDHGDHDMVDNEGKVHEDLSEGGGRLRGSRKKVQAGDYKAGDSNEDAAYRANEAVRGRKRYVPPKPSGIKKNVKAAAAPRSQSASASASTSTKSAKATSARAPAYVPPAMSSSDEPAAVKQGAAAPVARRRYQPPPPSGSNRKNGD